MPPLPVQTELIQSLFSFLRVSLMIVLIVTPNHYPHGTAPPLSTPGSPAQPLYRLFGWMRIRKQSVMALFVGIIFGIAYGGGVLLEEKRSGALNRRDALLVGIFPQPQPRPHRRHPDLCGHWGELGGDLIGPNSFYYSIYAGPSFFHPFGWSRPELTRNLFFIEF